MIMITKESSIKVKAEILFFMIFEEIKKSYILRQVKIVYKFYLSKYFLKQEIENKFSYFDVSK